MSIEMLAHRGRKMCFKLISRFRSSVYLTYDTFIFFHANIFIKFYEKENCFIIQQCMRRQLNNEKKRIPGYAKHGDKAEPVDIFKAGKKNVN
jgi:hypothetical protein